jgi:hypothetical protein
MRVLFKLALVFMVAIAAVSTMRNPAEAGVAGLTISGLDASAHVSSLAAPAYHYPHRSSFCHSVHIQCRLDTGHGYHYRRCMERRGCRFGHHHDHLGSCEYRRKGYSCGHWYHQCIRNWHYSEDIEGCLDYHCCGRHF